MKYQGSKLTVIIPMAGLGSRFSEQGFELPKPLIKIKGKPMIKWVYENIGLDANYVFIVQQSHIDNYNVDKILKSFSPNCSIVTLNGVTDGAARSVLIAVEQLPDDTPILIVNSDNLIEWHSDKAFAAFGNADGGIITTYGQGSKWSYVDINSAGYALKIAEKVQISTHATTGHYYWRRAVDYVNAARQMIAQEERYNNEFYVAPVYNNAISQGLNIATYECDKFWSVGTPEDLTYFLDNYLSEKLFQL